jgi:EF hand domain-containing protein
MWYEACKTPMVAALCRPQRGVIHMSYRRGIILAFSGLLALGAGSAAQAQDDRYRKTDVYNGDDRYRYPDDRLYKTGVYADDDFWYGERAIVTNTRFRGMDRDNDGVITRSEWRGNNRSFQNQDWNKDGVLSGREVRRNAVRVRNRNVRVEAVDRNRDGVIARSEWMSSRSEFNRLDRNRDGFITLSEARLRYN